MNRHFQNEQVAYKRGVTGPKKMATGINYCKNGRLAKTKVTLGFGHRLLAIISKVFLKKDIKTVRCICCYGDIFAFREFKLTI